MTSTQPWDTIAEQLPAPATLDTVCYGDGLPTEADLRLIGATEGRRILDLGCGIGQAAIALARGGAHVIAMDTSEPMLRRARTLAEQAETTIEWRHADLADLAFLRAEAIDAAVAVDSLGEVDDIDRVFRQVNRVLKPNAPFVFTLPHPAHLCTRPESPGAPGGLPLDRLVVRRDYADETPLERTIGETTVVLYPRTIASVFASLHRASYRVDQILEPEPTDAPAITVPPVVLWRARKEGS